MKKEQNCPCGRSKTYINCCARAHQNIINAKTAEDLMRSRYVAFTMGNGDYLMDSHHSMTKRLDRKGELVLWANSVKWLKLEVIKTIDGGEDDTEGIVEFKAHFKEGKKRKVMHQTGKFYREFGHWVYFDVV